MRFNLGSVYVPVSFRRFSVRLSVRSKHLKVFISPEVQLLINDYKDDMRPL